MRFFDLKAALMLQINAEKLIVLLSFFILAIVKNTWKLVYGFNIVRNQTY